MKVSVATTLKRCKGGQFALHAMALPGNPYDGHTLETVIPAMEATIGADIERILADAGYRGHNAPLSHKFRAFTAGQKRRMTSAIKRQTRRRSAVGHIKKEHRMGRNYSRRCRQRHPGRRRLQLRPPAQLAASRRLAQSVPKRKA